MLTRRCGDKGNVLLTMPVLMIATLLAVVVFADSHRSLGQSRVDSDESRAAAAAELAVHEAFARIDAGESRTFTGAGTHDDTIFDYRAERHTSLSWEVHTQGTSGTITRKLVASIGREAEFAHSLFALEELTVDQNAGRITGRVGTNGAMTVFGPSPGSQQELYGPDASCTGCLDPVVLDGPRAFPEISEPEGTTRSCPRKGEFSGVVNGRSGVPFVCDDDDAVVFDEEVRIINPPLVVFVSSDAELIFDDAEVNASGQAADFQLFAEGDEDDDGDSISAEQANIVGVIYAPGRSLEADSLDLVGSLTVRTLTVPRGNHADIAADNTLEAVGNSPWRIISLGPDRS